MLLGPRLNLLTCQRAGSPPTGLSGSSAHLPCSPSLWDSQHWGGMFPKAMALPFLFSISPGLTASHTTLNPHTPPPCRLLQMPHSDLPWPPQPLQGTANRHLQAISCGQNTTLCLSRMSSVQLNSVTQSCPTLCNPMDCSTPGLPVLHQLLEFTQTHVHSR